MRYTVSLIRLQEFLLLRHSLNWVDLEREWTEEDGKTEGQNEMKYGDPICTRTSPAHGTTDGKEGPHEKGSIDVSTTWMEEPQKQVYNRRVFLKDIIKGLMTLFNRM